MHGVRVQGVTKSFGGTRALDGLNLDVAEGELLVLVGPSGCGKTTLLRVIAGLEDPDEGQVLIGERDVTRDPPSGRDVAMVFQGYALFPHMTVRENLGFGSEARRQPKAVTAARIAAVAEGLGLEGLLDRRPRQLSGGERQRVALGRAMVREPVAFLMDEPLSNLDAQLRVQTRGEIVRLQGRLRTTTVYVTHDQVEALSMGHRVGVLRDGSLEQVGTPEEVYERPASLFVGTFIGSPPMNVLRATAGAGDLRWAGGSIAGDAPGGEVVVGVRPEHVHVSGSRWSDRARPGPTFTARVELIEPVGDQTHLTLEASGERVLARVEPRFHPAPGTEVTCWFDPDRIHRFDPMTERALA